MAVPELLEILTSYNWDVSTNLDPKDDSILSIRLKEVNFDMAKSFDYPVELVIQDFVDFEIERIINSINTNEFELTITLLDNNKAPRREFKYTQCKSINKSCHTKLNGERLAIQEWHVYLEFDDREDN